MLKLQQDTIYSASELAEWFGISRKTFTNNRLQKLEDLKVFCDFESAGRGKYHIIEVHIDTYDRDLLKTKGKISAVLPDYLQTLDTCSNVGTKINRELFNNRYSNKYISYLVGQIIKDEPEKYVYKKTVGAKRGENGYATFRLFTEEERELYNATIQEYVQELADDKAQVMREAIKKRETGEITNREFNKMSFDLAADFSFLEFHSRVRRKLNLSEEEYANRIRDFD